MPPSLHLGWLPFSVDFKTKISQDRWCFICIVLITAVVYLHLKCNKLPNREYHLSVQFSFFAQFVLKFLLSLASL